MTSVKAELMRVPAPTTSAIRACSGGVVLDWTLEDIAQHCDTAMLGRSRWITYDIRSRSESPVDDTVFEATSETPK